MAQDFSLNPLNKGLCSKDCLCHFSEASPYIALQPVNPNSISDKKQVGGECVARTPTSIKSLCWGSPTAHHQVSHENAAAFSWETRQPARHIRFTDFFDRVAEDFRLEYLYTFASGLSLCAIVVCLHGCRIGGIFLPFICLCVPTRIFCASRGVFLQSCADMRAAGVK